MKSTDHNLNNPMKILDLATTRITEVMAKQKFMGKITQEEYDLIQIHDPCTIYMVEGKDGRCVLYSGDMLISAPEVKNKYYLGMNDNNEYVIYVDTIAGTTEGYFNSTQSLVPVCAYNDPQVALAQLAKFNKIGSHYDNNEHLYNLIKSYIDKDISTHELLISILVTFNYKEDYRLQNVIDFAVSHNNHKCPREFNGYFSDNIRTMRDNLPESLFVLYSNLYDLLVKYNFFKDKKYTENFDNLNLTSEIQDIVKVVYFKDLIYPY